MLPSPSRLIRILASIFSTTFITAAATLFIAIPSLAVIGILIGACTRHITTSDPVILTATHNTLQADSIRLSILESINTTLTSHLVSAQSIHETIRETTVLNANGDTTRHDTHTSVNTATLLSLQRENRIHRHTIDSLASASHRTDTVRVPVPYRVAVPAKLTTWQTIRLKAFWPLIVAIVLLILSMRFLKYK